MNSADDNAAGAPDKDTVRPLTGSTPPGTSDASFEPVTEPEPGYRCLKRPVFRSSSQRLADLVAEHRRLIDFYDAASTAEDNPEHQRRKDETGHADASDHAIRMLRECEGMIMAIPARSLTDLGLKARALSWTRADWWDEQTTEEIGARNLVDDVLNLAGIDRVRRADVSFEELLPGYAGAPRHLPDEEASADPSEPTELGQLQREYRAAVLRLDALEDAPVPETSLDQKKNHRMVDRESALINSIETRASYVRAETLRDALFQVLLLSSDVVAWINPAKGATGTLTSEMLEDRIGRHLYSIRLALERHLGVKGRDLDAGYNMSERFDPFTALTEEEPTPARDARAAA